MANHQGQLVSKRTNTKAIIRQSCLEVLANPKVKPSDKLKAASILQRLCEAKDLAREKKRELKRTNGIRRRPGRPKQEQVPVYDGISSILANGDQAATYQQSNAND